jgi:hypothetical protein
VCLTKGGETIEGKLEIGLDRRAAYTAADRREQFEAVMKAHALFGEMTELVGRLDSLREVVSERAGELPKEDALSGKLRALADEVETLKKKIVATKEGGDITGEERIREHLDTAYGALIGWEGKPASYQVERVEVLRRELGDVAAALQKLVAEKVQPLDAELRKRDLEGLLPPMGAGG